MTREAGLEELAHPEYWNQRYTSELKLAPDGTPTIESYEWLRSFKKLWPFLEEHLPPASGDCHVLHLGCGNSSLTADLYDIGYTNQTSVDFSQVVIDAMNSKYSALKTRWALMDVQDLQLPTSSVDVAIDKSTLDPMIHGSMWDPPEDVVRNVGKYVSEVARILKPGGRWLCITLHQPHFIKPLLIREEFWSLSVEVLEDPENAGAFAYFGFIMKRH